MLRFLDYGGTLDQGARHCHEKCCGFMTFDVLQCTKVRQPVLIIMPHNIGPPPGAVGFPFSHEIAMKRWQSVPSRRL